MITNATVGDLVQCEVGLVVKLRLTIPVAQHTTTS